jgi:hypothetical protein
MSMQKIVEYRSGREYNAGGLPLTRVEQIGIRSLTAGPLSFATALERPLYEGVAERGLRELGALLRQHRVLD